MKHPNQFWHEYKTSVYGEGPVPRMQDREVCRAFHAGAEATFKVLDVIEANINNNTDAELVESLDWFRSQNRTVALSPIETSNSDELPAMDITDMIHTFRTLRLSQVRKQLESDEKNNIDRLFHIYHFLKLAKEQQP